MKTELTIDGKQDGRSELAEELLVQNYLEKKSMPKWALRFCEENHRETAKAVNTNESDVVEVSRSGSKPRCLQNEAAADLPHYNKCCECGRQSTKVSKIRPKGVKFICSICENRKEATKTK